MLAASTVARLFFRLFLKMLEFDLCSYPSCLICKGLLDLVGNLFLQSLQLLLMILLGLLKQFRESALLRLLFTDRLT